MTNSSFAIRLRLSTRLRTRAGSEIHHRYAIEPKREEMTMMARARSTAGGPRAGRTAPENECHSRYSTLSAPGSVIADIQHINITFIMVQGHIIVGPYHGIRYHNHTFITGSFK